ncbi:unnamed protein product [Mytilus coruscus]|uniref:Uncharacterized protein n=1 Tax=Mytilus coruscus TaxID=42192 RepID=A0A6J8AQ28_MYTCO|nr:unnamed protein product [Mytilus coruscus]
MYHDNGNSAACIAYPKTQVGCRNGWERLDNSTSDNDTETNLPDDTTYTPTVNPPAYEDIINRNTAAIVSCNPRTYKEDDEERIANSTVNYGIVTNLSDDTTSIPTVNPPGYEDIIKK